MRTWELAVPLDAGSKVPVFLQISRALADDVRRGRLAPGAPLPGSRTLAQTLRVHRNTVLAAYRELAAEGWISTTHARGTFVSSALPELPARPFAAPRTATPLLLGYDLAPSEPARPAVVEVPRGMLSLGGGMPDVRLFPRAALARAYRRALKVRTRTLLEYADPRGHEGLRAALAQMLSSLRGLAATPENVLVTRGSQMGLDLISRALVRPGDVVAVEALGYRLAWQALRAAGATLVPVPVDGEGLDVDALARLCQRQRVRALYVTPHHQYPTTVGLSVGRRLRLLQLARDHRFALIEDDYDHEFHYEGRPVLPLASADRDGVVIYVGTLSKLLAPGLRLGFTVAPRPLIDRLLLLRQGVDRQGDAALEAALAELFEDGEVQRHARRARKTYARRREVLVDALRKSVGERLQFDVPAGGMALWAKAHGKLDVDAWAERARAQGVVLYPGRHFAFDGRPRPYVRLGFAALDERELREAVRRIAQVL